MKASHDVHGASEGRGSAPTWGAALLLGCVNWHLPGGPIGTEHSVQKVVGGEQARARIWKERGSAAANSLVLSSLLVTFPF